MCAWDARVCAFPASNAKTKVMVSLENNFSVLMRWQAPGSSAADRAADDDLAVQTPPVAIVTKTFWHGGRVKDWHGREK